MSNELGDGGNESRETPSPYDEAAGLSRPQGAVERNRLWILVGPQGLRAGWSFLLFAGICYVMLYAVGSLAAPLVHLNAKVPLSPITGLVMELSQFVPVIVATALMAFVERRPVLFYGYQGRARTVRFVFGLVWGFIAITVLVLVLHELGYLALEGSALHGGEILGYAAVWGAVFLLTGFFEESLLRGYAQFTLTRGLGFWWGAVLLSLLFGFSHGHNPGESPVGLFAAGAVGLVFCLSLWYTGSLWWAVGFHAAWDWGESYFYGTADSGLLAQGHLFREHPVGSLLWSGGATGPEGSVLVLPLLAMIALLMFLWWGRRGESPFAGAAWRPMRMPRPEGRWKSGAVLVMPDRSA